MIPLKRYFLPACKYTCRIIQPNNTSNHLNISCPGVSANLTGMPKYSSLSMIGGMSIMDSLYCFPHSKFYSDSSLQKLAKCDSTKKKQLVEKDINDYRCTSYATVDGRDPKQPPGMYKTWERNYHAQLVITGFLNHQQYYLALYPNTTKRKR